MILSKAQAMIFATQSGTKYGFDPFLLLAMIEQESAYDTEAVRLENGFFRKYERPLSLATTSKILRSTSFGLCQLMGESLAQLGYFDSAVNATPEGHVKVINAYMIDPATQVDTGGQWLKFKMTNSSTKDIVRGLTLYNGSSEYPPLVLARMERLKGESSKGLF